MRSVAGQREILEKLYKIGMKLFLDSSEKVEPERIIEIFHGWIQQQRIENHLLVDVHDYTHIHRGPGIVLIGHEGNFSLDTALNQSGLLYQRKHQLEGTLEERLGKIYQTLQTACRALEQSYAQLRFRSEPILVVANDRLRAPNEPETWNLLRPRLERFLRDSFGRADMKLTQSPDRQERFTVLAVGGGKPE